MLARMHSIRKSSRVLKVMSLVMATFLFDACSSMGVSTKNAPLKAGFNVKKVVLKNGLTVLVAPNPKLPIVSYYTLFDVGGRDEGPGTTGATHFLEHMMFKGTRNIGTTDYHAERVYLDSINLMYDNMVYDTDTTYRKNLYKKIKRDGRLNLY